MLFTHGFTEMNSVLKEVIFATLMNLGWYLNEVERFLADIAGMSEDPTSIHRTSPEDKQLKNRWKNENLKLCTFYTPFRHDFLHFIFKAKKVIKTISNLKVKFSLTVYECVFCIEMLTLFVLSNVSSSKVQRNALKQGCTTQISKRAKIFFLTFSKGQYDMILPI